MAFEDYELDPTGGNKVELYLFETADGIYRWGYTTDSEKYTVGLFSYEPEVISRTEISQSVGEGASKVTITVPYYLPVAAINVPYLSPNAIRVTIWEYHRGDAELRQVFTGYVNAFTQNAEYGELECAQIIDNVKQDVPWATYKKNCNWALYGVGCYVNRNSFKTTVDNITAVDASSIYSPDLAGFQADWFRNGYAVHPATGESRFIIGYDAALGQIRFNYPFREVDGTSVIEAFAGCDRTRQTCLIKFNNIANYLGFDWFPEDNVFQTGVK